VRKITDRDCGNWLTKYQQQYAPTASGANQDTASDRGGFVPPLTRKSWRRAELQNLISGIDDTWADASESLAAAFRKFTSAAEKKVTGSFPSAARLTSSNR
jgi:hypothetical protein